MDLKNALADIAPALDLDPDLLSDYANEDTYGGYDTNPANQAFVMGSMWAVEAKFVYALVRGLRPRHILEVGVGNGCTTTHILSAIKTNDFGLLTSLDPHPYNASNVPDELRGNWNYIAEYAEVWLSEHAAHFDLVIEDGPHDYPSTLAILKEAKKTGASLIVSHDAAHRDLGSGVQRAMFEALGACRVLLIDPSDCGLGYWIKEALR